MDTQYYIEVTVKTASGPEVFGKFFVGNSLHKAQAIFRQLKGSGNVNETDIMYLDLMGTRNGLPFSLEMITCTLDQLGENCKTITKEIFKMHALSVS